MAELGVLHPGMEVFKLEWNCNGRTFTPSSLPWCHSSFVYETIGWYLMNQKDRNDDENPDLAHNGRRI